LNDPGEVRKSMKINLKEKSETEREKERERVSEEDGRRDG